MPVDKITIELSEPICSCPDQRLSCSIGDYYCVEIKCRTCKEEFVIPLADFRRLTSVRPKKRKRLKTGISSKRDKPLANVLPFRRRT